MGQVDGLKELKVDSKWSVWYDTFDNDRPLKLTRYGVDVGINISAQQLSYVTAMFYALLEEREKLNEIYS